VTTLPLADFFTAALLTLLIPVGFFAVLALYSVLILRRRSQRKER